MATSELPSVADKTTDIDHSHGTQPPFTLADATVASIKALTPDATTGLHPLEIHNSGQPHPPGDAPQKVSDGPPAQAPSTSSPQEWTVGYYLGATKTMPREGTPGTPPPQNGDWGSAHKADQLKQMAEATKGTGVTVLVDALHEKDDVRAQRQKLVDDGKLSPDDLASHNPDDYLVDHYRLKDGQIEGLGSTQSKGLTGDVADLVSHASHDDPSKKVGLVMNVDGGGNRGAMGDSSPISSMDQLQGAIKDGLQGSGHDRLDILDMDACLMSQTGAVSSMSTVAKDIVASAETERSSIDRVDGQNLPSGLQHLLDQPQMSGKDWGEQIVGDAQSGANTHKPADGPVTRFDTGTSTLANIDGDKVKPLADATNKLGVALTEAAADPGNQRTINDIVDHLPRYGADGSTVASYGEQKRDLKSFTDQLQKALDAGTISDPSGRLSAALSEEISARQAAVTAYSGDPAGGFDKDGGLSVYLPDSTFRDLDKTLAQGTPLAQAAEVLSKFASLPPSTEGPAQVRDGSATAGSAQQYVGSYFQKLDPQQREEAAPVVHAMEQLQAATSQQERQAALKNASDVAQEMLRSPLQRQLIAAQDHQAADQLRSKNLDREMADELPGWKSFVQSMGWTS